MRGFNLFWVGPRDSVSSVKNTVCGLHFFLLSQFFVVV
jgi:hypothetical protein